MKSGKKKKKKKKKISKSVCKLIFNLCASSAYGFDDFPGDMNDRWRVEIIHGDKTDPESKDRLRTIHTKFALVHIASQCSLFSHSVKLPDWGFDQQEVTCIKNGKIEKTVWYVESTENGLRKFFFFWLLMKVRRLINVCSAIGY
jgi:dolichyl-phosphate-mannose--protein O-mannosyl transferase